MEDRTKSLEALARAVAERGLGVVTSASNAKLAQLGISHGELVRMFGGLDGALLAAFELGVERATPRLREAFDGAERWLDAVRNATAAFLRFLEDESALGRLLVVDSLSAGEPVLRRRVELTGVLAGYVERGNGERRGALAVPAVVAEGVVGALLTVIQNVLLSSERSPIDLYGELVSVVVLPYLGAAAARRELRLAPPGPVAPGAGAPAQGAPAPAPPRRRLTYRSMRALSAVAEHPGASNREIAERAGIVDQGQAAKLLARLHAAGLLVRSPGSRRPGTPNAWRLTDAGRDALEEATRARIRSSGRRRREPGSG